MYVSIFSLTNLILRLNINLSQVNLNACLIAREFPKVQSVSQRSNQGQGKSPLSHKYTTEMFALSLGIIFLFTSTSIVARLGAGGGIEFEQVTRMKNDGVRKTKGF